MRCNGFHFAFRNAVLCYIPVNRFWLPPVMTTPGKCGLCQVVTSSWQVKVTQTGCQIVTSTPRKYQAQVYCNDWFLCHIKESEGYTYFQTDYRYLFNCHKMSCTKEKLLLVLVAPSWWLLVETPLWKYGISLKQNVCIHLQTIHMQVKTT